MFKLMPKIKHLIENYDLNRNA